MQFKTHINKLVRIQTSENRDIKKGVLLDRNERVENFDEGTYKKILKSISRYSINATPDIQDLYKLLSKTFKINKKNIYIGQGITELMSQIIFSLVKKNEEVILMDPTYPMYDVWCKLHGVKYKKWKFNKDYKLDTRDLKKIINKKTKILFIVNPNLPIEYELNSKQKKEVYSICKKNKTILVYDEAYYHFGSKSEIKNSLNKDIIVMRTFSKAWGLPSIRLGFLVTNKKLRDYLSKCRSLVETNALSFQIAMWALKNKTILKQHVNQIKRGSKYLTKEFKKISQPYIGGKVTNAMLVKLKSPKEVTNLKKFMENRKIYIRTNFKNQIENFFRISLGSERKMKIFFNAFLKWKLFNDRSNK